MPRITASRGRIWAYRIVALLGSLVLALVVLEVALRVLAPNKGLHAGRELTQFRTGGKMITDIFTIDDQMGFRPRLGTTVYSEYGTLCNSYPIEKRNGVSRVLFVGDSVTARGRIVAALRKVYGDEKYEYWNAGVEAFDTVQELAFYKLYNSRIRPDHVVLTFHLNDFETTPISYLDSQGQLVVYAPNCPTRQINRTLFEHSHVYRLYVGATTQRDWVFPKIAGEVKAALREFKTAVEPGELTVLIHPYLQPEARWSDREQRAYREITQILDDLQIRHFDLGPLATAAAGQGIDIQESPGDTWHPSDTLADFIAANLQREHVLDPSATVAGRQKTDAVPVSRQ